VLGPATGAAGCSTGSYDWLGVFGASKSARWGLSASNKSLSDEIEKLETTLKVSDFARADDRTTMCQLVHLDWIRLDRCSRQKRGS
jgi:hypothetical protein